jgi:catechol 2,3-dioxygenase-like lactoylglutathione lyase family enzyme
MRVRAIDFVVVNVADLDRSERFYRETLGLRVPLTESSERWRELDSPPVALALRLDAASPGVNAAVALAVEDVRAAVEELRAAGVPILLEPYDTEVCVTAMIRDPDGNLLLLHQRKDGSAG